MSASLSQKQKQLGGQIYLENMGLNNINQLSLLHISLQPL